MNQTETVDAITLEVIREGLISIVREMRVNLGRTAYSSVLYESHDYSCCIMNDRGELVAQGEDLPSHIFPISWSVKKMMKGYLNDLHQGDIFLHNDPYDGGTHLNDVAFIYTNLFDKDLFLFPVIRAHWGDVGGMTPGSLSGRTREIFQEGVRMPFMRITEKGKLNQTLLNLIFANMRIPVEREGDFDAILGTCMMAERRLRVLVTRYGMAQMRMAVDMMLDRAETRMKVAISEIKDGEYRYESYMDHCGNNPEPVRIGVNLRVEGSEIYADCSDSSPQVDGPINAGPAVTESGVFIAIKSALDPLAPINQGALRPIHVVTQPETVLHAQYPVPCGGFAEVRRCVEGTVMGALAQAVPDQVGGEVKGTAQHIYIGGNNPRRNKLAFLYYEYPSGGTGGHSTGDGNEATKEYSSGDFSSIQPVEALENEFPLFIEQTELRQDSEGSGQYRGGLGLRRDVRLESPKAIFSVLSDHNVIPPYGVLSGYWGAPNTFTVIRNGKEFQPAQYPGKLSGFELKKGDVVVERSSGGGGYGDPLLRDPDRVYRDVIFGYITPKRARERYGVVIHKGRLDLKKTAKLRQKMDMQRIRLIVKSAESVFDGNQRKGLIHPDTASALKVEHNDLMECVAPQGAPLRVWAEISTSCPKDQIWISPRALSCLRPSDGQTIWIRKVALHAKLRV